MFSADRDITCLGCIPCLQSPFPLAPSSLPSRWSHKKQIEAFRGIACALKINNSRTGSPETVSRGQSGQCGDEKCRVATLERFEGELRRRSAHLSAVGCLGLDLRWRRPGEGPRSGPKVSAVAPVTSPRTYLARFMTTMDTSSLSSQGRKKIS